MRTSARQPRSLTERRGSTIFNGLLEDRTGQIGSILGVHEALRELRRRVHEPE